jgi:GNAT superfamily N-acetyltransferase
MLMKLLSADYETSQPVLELMYSSPVAREEVHAIHWGARRIGRIEIGWDSNALILYQIEILPQFRKIGLGTKIIKELLDIAVVYDRKWLIITCTANNSLLHIAARLNHNTKYILKTWFGYKVYSEGQTLRKNCNYRIEIPTA